MFDIAFSELLLIGLVALIVIGPERLPKVARMAGTWLGKLNRYVSQVKQDINRDMQLEELRKLQAEMKETAQKYEIMAKEAEAGFRRQAEETTDQVSKVVQAMSATDGGLAQREFDKLKAEVEQAPAETGPQPPADNAGRAEDEDWRELNKDLVEADVPAPAVPPPPAETLPAQAPAPQRPADARPDADSKTV